MQVVLVASGLREGLLVDSFCVDSSTLQALLEHVWNSLSGEGGGFVIVEVATGDHFVLCAKWFVERLDKRKDLDDFLFVDIAGSNPNLVNGSERERITESLGYSLHDIYLHCKNSIENIPVSSLLLYPNTSIVGYECLAGFLLGYSCVYNCGITTDGSSRYSNSLSMLPLIKVSISANFQLDQEYVVTVKEFTMPKDILSLSGKAMQGVNCSDSEMLLRRLVDESFDRMMHHVRERGFESFLKIAMKFEEVSFPSFTF